MHCLRFFHEYEVTPHSAFRIKIMSTTNKTEASVAGRFPIYYIDMSAISSLRNFELHPGFIEMPINYVFFGVNGLFLHYVFACEVTANGRDDKRSYD